MGNAATQQPRTRVKTVFSTLRQTQFLEAFSNCGSVQLASRWAKISRAAHYEWLKHDSTYQARFNESLKAAARRFEDEAVRRAVAGTKKGVYYKGKLVATETEYSDALLTLLLKANNPDKFTERQKVETTQVVKTLADVPTEILLELLPEETRAAFIAEHGEVLDLAPRQITDGSGEV